jgi:hypothetical protein
MAKVLLISIALLNSLLAQEPGGERILNSVSLSRQDLPEHFPYQLLSEGFAVLGITLRNNSKENWSVSVEDLEVYSKKGKRIKRALPTDITPKILKYYTGIVGYDGHPQARTVREEMYQQKTIGVRTGQPMVSLDTVEGLRNTLERHQLKDSVVTPGETLEAFYYLKSKDNSNKLQGGWVILQGIKAHY